MLLYIILHPVEDSTYFTEKHRMGSICIWTTLCMKHSHPSRCFKKISIYFLKLWSYKNAAGIQGRLFFLDCVSWIRAASSQIILSSRRKKVASYAGLHVSEHLLHDGFISGIFTDTLTISVVIYNESEIFSVLIVL